jgi:hypothetical protein
VTVALKVNPTEAIDIDRYTGMMRELKEQESEFYNDLVKLSVLQGTLDTNLSISLIIPVEDRAKIIAPVIDVLQPSSELEAFNKEGLFYRNNFSDDRIVPEIKPRYQTVDSGLGLQIDYRKTDTFLASLANGITPGSGKLVSLNNKYSFMNGADKDFLKMKRYQYVSGLVGGSPATIVVDITTGNQMSSKEFTKLSNEGTLSKYEMVGYKKVKSEDSVPLTIQRKVRKSLDEFSVFKMVNLYGSPRIVTEYPKLMTPSTFDNNTFEVKEELTDNFIISILSGQEVAAPQESTFVDDRATTSIVEQETARPTEEVTATPSSFQDAIDKVFEKRFDDYMGDDYFYLDLPSGLTQAQLTDILDANNYKKYEKTISTLEDFKKAQEIEKQYPKVVIVYDGYGDSTTKGLRDVIESELTELSAEVGNEIEYFQPDNFESLIRDFENGRIPEEFREAAEEKLNELGLIGLVGYNPNQLPMFDVVDPITKNRMDMESEYQNGTLKVSVLPNGSKYFVLLDGRILDANPKSLGNESVTDPDMKDMILDKAVIYKKTC